MALSDKLSKYKFPGAVFLSILLLLSVVQLKIENPMILAERFIKGAGWVEIVVISFYGAFISYKMQDPVNAPKWRLITWSIFSVVFFLQLIIGLLGHEKFLMTGKLHLPIPMMIIAGPIYRGQISFMTILFLSTVILSGPAWCSQLCYFGAFDNLASQGKTTLNPFRRKTELKSSFFFLVILSAIILRWLNFSILETTLIAGAFGVAGIIVIIFLSGKRKKMVHCVLYCPVGTLVNILKPINPFRMYIDNSCTLCMGCTRFCKYDALGENEIKNKKPGVTCTYCGDCIAGCKHNSIKYRFFSLHPERARKLYIAITISLHAVFLALARI